MKPQEIWKDIPGYEGKYQVSNLGNVRHLLKERRVTIIIHKRLLRPGKDRDYLKVALRGHGRSTTYRVHRLVAKAFIGNPIGKEVNHIDGNGKNNTVENLEIVTRLENMQHAKANGFISGKKKKVYPPRSITKYHFSKKLTSRQKPRWLSNKLSLVDKPGE